MFDDLCMYRIYMNNNYFSTFIVNYINYRIFAVLALLPVSTVAPPIERNKQQIKNLY